MYERGLKLWSTNTGAYFDEAIRLYQAKVYDYIELYVVPGSLTCLAKWEKLKIPYVIHNAHFMQGFNLAKSENEASNRAIYDETKIFADALGVQHIIFHGGIDGDIVETARQLRDFNEPRALIENKPKVALPNRMGGKECRGYSREEIELVMKIAGCGFCLDFGHAICAANTLQLEPYAFIEDLMTLNPVMFHLTDVEDISSVFDTHLHLGEGQLDIRRMMTLVKDEPVTFETTKNSQENLNDFERDMTWLKTNL